MLTYITFLFVTSFEETSLLRERNTFSGSRNPALTSIQGHFNQHQKAAKFVDKFTSHNGDSFQNMNYLT